MYQECIRIGRSGATNSSKEPGTGTDEVIPAAYRSGRIHADNDHQGSFGPPEPGKQYSYRDDRPIRGRDIGGMPQACEERGGSHAGSNAQIAAWERPARPQLDIK